MKKIIITGPFSPDHKRQFSHLHPQAECIFAESENITSDFLSQAQALIGNLPVELLKEQRQLEWMQLISSGAVSRYPLFSFILR